MKTSERLSILHHITRKGGVSSKNFADYEDAMKGLMHGDLYWNIYFEEEERTYLKKEAHAVAERIYKLYLGRDRYATYAALCMARKKREHGHED